MTALCAALHAVLFALKQADLIYHQSLNIYSPTHLPIDPSIGDAIHTVINPSIHPSICLAILCQLCSLLH